MRGVATPRRNAGDASYGDAIVLADRQFVRAMTIGSPIGPLAKGGLDEALGFAVGARRIDLAEVIPHAPARQTAVNGSEYVELDNNQGGTNFVIVADTAASSVTIPRGHLNSSCADALLSRPRPRRASSSAIARSQATSRAVKVGIDVATAGGGAARVPLVRTRLSGEYGGRDDGCGRHGLPRRLAVVRNPSSGYGMYAAGSRSTAGSTIRFEVRRSARTSFLIPLREVGEGRQGGRAVIMRPSRP